MYSVKGKLIYYNHAHEHKCTNYIPATQKGYSNNTMLVGRRRRRWRILHRADVSVAADCWQGANQVNMNMRKTA